MSEIKTLEIIPSYFADSSWWEHVPVAHILVELLEPNVVVELGSHNGVSFFSFCEAAEKLSSKSHIYAIDSWEGDVQAGYYGEEVYQRVKQHKDSFYADRATLLRKKFDDALSEFEDNSIDLLHIDGLHTYDAVKHDLTTWEQKVKDGGTIIFHDWNEKGDGFGVWKLWEEIKGCEKYKCIEFENGHGLGIATLSNKSPIWHDKVKEYMYTLVCKGKLLSEINKRDRELRLNDVKLRIKDEHISNLEKMYSSRSKELMDAILQIEEINKPLNILELIKRAIMKN